MLVTVCSHGRAFTEHSFTSSDLFQEELIYQALEGAAGWYVSDWSQFSQQVVPLILGSHFKVSSMQFILPT